MAAHRGPFGISPTPTRILQRQLRDESSAPSPSSTPLKPAKIGVNASVGACVAIGTLTIVGAMFYLWFRRRRHSRQIQDQETREANLAAVEAGSGPSPFVPVVPAALVKEWRVSDERAWRAELRKELEADVRELKRQDRNKDIDAGEVMMVEDVRKPFKGKDKSPS